MISWRTATTPTGPIAGKTIVPRAAPVWLAPALVTSAAMPRERCPGVAVSDDTTVGCLATGVAEGATVMRLTLGPDLTFS